MPSVVLKRYERVLVYRYDVLMLQHILIILSYQ